MEGLLDPAMFLVMFTAAQTRYLDTPHMLDLCLDMRRASVNTVVRIYASVRGREQQASIIVGVHHDSVPSPA